MRITPMTEETLPAVAALEQECFSRPWSEAALRAELQNPHAVFLVAWLGDIAVGYTGMHHILDECEITNIAVATHHRRRGIASALLKEVRRYAQANGIIQVSLEVRAGNDGAIALYEAHGFTEGGRRKNYYSAPVEDALLFFWKRGKPDLR